MPFEEVQIGGQHTQEMVIESIHDEWLRCRMSAFEGTEAGAGLTGPTILFKPCGRGSATRDGSLSDKIVDVSKPHGLRKVDMPAGYTWVDSNTRKDADGNEESLQVPYTTGEKIHVTKGLVEPMDTAAAVEGVHYFQTLFANTTVDIFVDENRQGRSWGSPSGSGLPSGYSGKCIVLCENGTEISGQVLFKSGCEGAALDTGTADYEAEVAGNSDLSGNLSGDTITGTPITVYLHVGSGTNSPISGNWDFEIGPGSTSWTGQFTGDLLNNNWVAVKIPTGQKVDVIPYNGYTYVIPQMFEKLSGIGTNSFAFSGTAPGSTDSILTNYDVLIAPTTGFAAFVGYAANIGVHSYHGVHDGKLAEVIAHRRMV